MTHDDVHDVPPLSFEEIRAREIELIARARSANEVETSASLIGLALSGGGIRSATFNLGVLQGLCELRLLRTFDYLSTVSGGGYIGGFLSALIHREGQGDAMKIESTLASWDRVHEAEHRSVRFLRAHSNYLTPRIGIVSADTMTAVAIYLRNLVLNLLLLAATLSCVLLGIRVLGWMSHVIVPAGPAWILACAAALLAVAIVACAVNLARTAAQAQQTWVCEWWFVALAVVGAAGLAAWLLSHTLWIAARAGHHGWHWVPAVALGYALCWGAGIIVSLLLPCADTDSRSVAGRLRSRAEPLRRRPLRWWLSAIFFALVAGATAGVLFKLIAEGYQQAWAMLAEEGLRRLGWMVPAFGAALVFLVFMFAVTLHVGLVGRQFSEEQREWWGRVGAYCNAWILGWVALFAFAYLAAPSVQFAGVAASGLGLAGIITTVSGVIAGRSARTDGESAASPRWMEMLAKLAPYIFAVAILFLLGWAIDRLLVTLVDAGACAAEPPRGASFLDYVGAWACTASVDAIEAVLPVLGTAAAVTLLLSLRINVNLFSYHQFYRFRLTRCYLGATQADRRPHPLTGIDPDDDLTLASLTQRPYLIINAALNLAAGRQLAWQTRKSASFILSPLHCGYFRVSTREARGNYRPTVLYGASGRTGGFKLGAAIATSGAAASPNMGFHTSPPVAFLLTVFNVRLGRWCPNPSRPNWAGRGDPGSSLRYLLTELAGTADMGRDFVYLSDGGHFENTGIYELVRRQLRVIVASDCGADPKVRFDDISNAIRRCQVDLGTSIEIDLAPLRRAPATGYSVAHHAVGTIRYPDGSTGTLIVLKPTLNERVPTEVLGYAAKNPAFPQQPTSDQWFDEDQFESYRRLGQHIALTALGPIRHLIEPPRVAQDPPGH